MTCAEFQESIARYVGGDLAADDAAAVERHLRACPVCAELGRELEEDRAWLASRPPEVASVDFAAMRGEIRRSIARPRWGRKWLAAAAAILLIAGLAMMTRRTKERTSREGRSLQAASSPSVARRAMDTPGEAVVGADEIGSGHFPRRPQTRQLTSGVRSRARSRESLRLLPPSEPESPVQIRIATRDPNVTIILVNETRQILQ